METVLIYNDECIACTMIQRIVKKIDIKENIIHLPHRKSKELLRIFYHDGDIPLDLFIIEVSDNGGKSYAYRARKALPRIIRAILRRN